VEKFGPIHKVIPFVRDEGNNLGTMAITLWSIIYCDTFKLLWVYEDICFKHVMCKTCQYVTNDDKVSTSLTLVSMKDVQTSLQKIIIWTKKSRKGRHEWEKACIENEMWHWKLKTNENKVCEKNYNVEETLEFKQTILLCYGRWKTLIL
jgi:hypothetical protein